MKDFNKSSDEGIKGTNNSNVKEYRKSRIKIFNISHIQTIERLDNKALGEALLNQRNNTFLGRRK